MQANKQFAALLEALSQLPSGSSPAWNEKTTAFYAMTLADLDPDVLRGAVLECCRTCRFRPTPADIREIADKIMATNDTTVTDELAQVLALVQRYGPNGRKHRAFPNSNVYELGEPEELRTLSRHAQAAVAAFGGWVSFATEQVESSILRAQFERLYKASAAGASSAHVRTMQLEYRATHGAEIETPAMPEIVEFQQMDTREAKQTMETVIDRALKGEACP